MNISTYPFVCYQNQPCELPLTSPIHAQKSRSFSRQISASVKGSMSWWKHCDINGFQPCSGKWYHIVSEPEVQHHLLTGRVVNFKNSISFSGSLCWLSWFSEEPQINRIQNEYSRCSPDASKAAPGEFLHHLSMREMRELLCWKTGNITELVLCEKSTVCAAFFFQYAKIICMQSFFT